MAAFSTVTILQVFCRVYVDNEHGGTIQPLNDMFTRIQQGIGVGLRLDLGGSDRMKGCTSR